MSSSELIRVVKVNPLDRLNGPYDSVVTLDVCDMLFEHYYQGRRRDPFFHPASRHLMQVVILIAKATTFPDLFMVHSILSLTELGLRLNHACDSSHPTLLYLKNMPSTAKSVITSALAPIQYLFNHDYPFRVDSQELQICSLFSNSLDSSSRDINSQMDSRKRAANLLFPYPASLGF